MKSSFKELIKGLVHENPTFVLMLGLCPTLAVSISLINGLGMGVAATFVIVFSNILIASLKDIIPDKVRIPCYIVVIATFVTITELVMKAYFPPLNRALGIYVPLIVVNCIVLGRAEAFASKNKILNSLMDGIGMGIGFTLALLLISGVRELLGSGRLFGYSVFRNFEPMLIIAMPSGALLVIGLLLGLFNFLKEKKE
jgi:electron transport complex protein RnfE